MGKKTHKGDICNTFINKDKFKKKQNNRLGFTHLSITSTAQSLDMDYIQ